MMASLIERWATKAREEHTQEAEANCRHFPAIAESTPSQEAALSLARKTLEAELADLRRRWQKGEEMDARGWPDEAAEERAYRNFVTLAQRIADIVDELDGLKLKKLLSRPGRPP